MFEVLMLWRLLSRRQDSKKLWYLPFCISCKAVLFRDEIKFWTRVWGLFLRGGGLWVVLFFGLVGGFVFFFLASYVFSVFVSISWHILYWHFLFSFKPQASSFLLWWVIPSWVVNLNYFFHFVFGPIVACHSQWSVWVMEWSILYMSVW